VGGVADYTAILSRRLVEVSDGAAEPMLIHAGKQIVDSIEVDFPTVDLSGECSATALAETIDRWTGEAEGRVVVLLEYSGYGYAKRGAPLWLARGLQRVCGEGGVPLVTMFHEISTSGPVWTRAFWFSPIQSWVAGRIAQLSGGVMTTHPAGADELANSLSGHTPVEVCPVFSNVGEPEERPTLDERPYRAVVFGGQRTKMTVYDTHRAGAQQCLNRWEIDIVCDVGNPEAAVRDTLSQEVEVYGYRPAEDISRLLLGARIGLMHYPAAYATKSGVLAAYMAHGVIPVLLNPEPLGGKLKAGTHFVTVKHSMHKSNPEGDPCIAENAAAWYDEHAHSRHTAIKILALLELALGGRSKRGLS
jgi:hypothetical protein